MRQSVLAGIALGLLTIGPAVAADMAVKAPIMNAAPMPIYNWTGCYIGGGGGYGLWKQDVFAESDPGQVAFTTTTTAGGSGWFGTAGLGCDYQVTSSIVVGAYGDWDFGNINGVFTLPSSTLVGTESEKWAWAVGGRIGWLVTPTVLTYFSGGYTQAHFDSVSLNNSIVIAPSVAFSVAEHTYNGWFLGSGFDYAISFLPTGFFLRSEYRYSNYKAADLSSTALDPGFVINSKKIVQSVRSELIYRFNWSR
jgi:outer membrane immunogenic protein